MIGRVRPCRNRARPCCWLLTLLAFTLSVCRFGHASFLEDSMLALCFLPAVEMNPRTLRAPANLLVFINLCQCCALGPSDQFESFRRACFQRAGWCRSAPAWRLSLRPWLPFSGGNLGPFWTPWACCSSGWQLIRARRFIALQEPKGKAKARFFGKGERVAIPG